MGDDSSSGRSLADHRAWKVVAWSVGTIIALAGLVLGLMEYRDARQEAREAKAATAAAEAALKAEVAQRALVETCARATDVFDTLIALWRAVAGGAGPQDVDLPVFREQLRHLNEWANRTESATLREAASGVRSKFGLLTADRTLSPQAVQEVNTGVFQFVEILSECQRAGRAIPTMPPDLNLPAGTPVPAAPAVLGVTATASVNGQQGAVVQAVTPESAAARGGLLPGDLIVGVGGYLVTDVPTLQQTVQLHRAGQTAVVAYLRNGAYATTYVTF